MVPGQSIPSIHVSGLPAEVRGYWSLWIFLILFVAVIPIMVINIRNLRRQGVGA